MLVRKFLLPLLYFCTLVQAQPPVDVCDIDAGPTLCVDVSYNVGTAEDLVNAELGEGRQRQNLKAMSVSGGGSRSLSLERGHLGVLSSVRNAQGKSLLDQLDYVSAVSGGAWAAAAYLSSPEVVNSNEILGSDHMDMENIFVTHHKNDSARNINWMSTRSLGCGPQRLGGLFDLAGQLVWGEVWPWGYGDQTWSSIIDRELLAPFDIESFVPLHRAYAKGIGRDKEIIIVSAIRDHHAELHLLEMSSKWVGVRSKKNGIGGYRLPARGFGLKAVQQGNGTVVLQKEGIPFSLSDALSASSDNYAHLGTLLSTSMPAFLGFIPELIQSIVNAAVPNVRYPLLSPYHFDFNNRVFELVDAGPIDYLGIIPLLARGISKILVLVNTDIPLVVSYRHGQAVVGMEKMIPALFGVCPDDTSQRPGYVGIDAGSCEYHQLRHHQMFGKERFQELADGLLASKEKGKAVVYEQRGLRVLPNRYYAVEGSYEVDLFWVYNDIPDGWLETLPEDVRKLVREDDEFKCHSDRCAGTGTRFPHNSAMYELGLSEAPGNLLAVLAYNTLLSCAEQLKEFFDR